MYFQRMINLAEIVLNLPQNAKAIGMDLNMNSGVQDDTDSSFSPESDGFRFCIPTVYRLLNQLRVSMQEEENDILAVYYQQNTAIK